MRVTNCEQLLREAGRDAVLRDEVCAAQCSNIILNSPGPTLEALEEVVSLTTKRPLPPLPPQSSRGGRGGGSDFIPTSLLPPPPPPAPPQIPFRRNSPRNYKLDLASIIKLVQ